MPRAFSVVILFALIARPPIAPVPAGASTSALIAGPQNPSALDGRFVALVAPVSGETLIGPGSIRLVAAAYDPNVWINSPHDGLGGNAAEVQFFVDDKMVVEVDGSQAEYYVFKGTVGDIPAGQHIVWARALYANPSLVLDSVPVAVTVTAAPLYGNTISLGADLTLSGTYSLTGTSTSRVRVNGNGHRIIGSLKSAKFQFVDFVDLGDRINTAAPGLDISVGGELVVENCTFSDSNTVQLAVNGSATVKGNAFHSNMRQPLGQTPDGSGGTVHGSFPAVVLQGSSSASKVFQGNSIAAGWLQLQSTQGWLIGGDRPIDGNILIGPRVGIYVDGSSSSVTVRGNYSHHVYYGGWSQASNFELGGVPDLVAERNVVIGSSWPVRGLAGEFRYNLVLEGGHEWLWADHDGANVHHNVFVGGDNDVGGIFVLYGPTKVRIQNNTFDGLQGKNIAAAVNLQEGDVTLTSNLFLNLPKSAVSVGRGSLVADYNLFWNSASPVYSDGRRPAHDMAADPRLANRSEASINFDEKAVWLRALSVSDILAQYRERYAPMGGSPAVDAGDPGSGAGNDIGAVGSGVPNARDQFGR